MATFNLTDTILIGANRHGYTFGIGRAADRWLGFAIGTADGERGLFVFPEVCEGCQLGMASQDAALALTAAIARSPDHAYGGIDDYYLPAAMLVEPDDFRCPTCRYVGCPGDCADGDELDEEPGP